MNQNLPQEPAISEAAVSLADCAQSPNDNLELPDDVLAAAGLRKVNAFIRTEQSANAARVKRARQKAAESGAAQFNVLAPIAFHKTIKDLSKSLQSGEAAQAVFENLLTIEAKAINPDAVVIVSTREAVTTAERIARKLACLGGLRRLIARLLGLI